MFLKEIIRLLEEFISLCRTSSYQNVIRICFYMSGMCMNTRKSESLYTQNYNNFSQQYFENFYAIHINTSCFINVIEWLRGNQIKILLHFIKNFPYWIVCLLPNKIMYWCIWNSVTPGPQDMTVFGDRILKGSSNQLNNAVSLEKSRNLDTGDLRSVQGGEKNQATLHSEKKLPLLEEGAQEEHEIRSL